MPRRRRSDRTAAARGSPVGALLPEAPGIARGCRAREDVDALDQRTVSAERLHFTAGTHVVARPRWLSAVAVVRQSTSIFVIASTIAGMSRRSFFSSSRPADGFRVLPRPPGAAAMTPAGD